MPPRIRTFDVEIRRELDVSALDALSDAEAEAADEEAYLGGNCLYQDLRGWSWPEVGQALDYETALVERITNAPNPAAAEARFEDERDLEDDSIEGLYGLDVGVAAAVFALSALGTVPFISCNAGSFGRSHQAAHPYVAFYLSKADPTVLLALAEDADVGLVSQEGVVRLYARSVMDLRRFVLLALERYDPSGD
jgi:hypothetical protein